MFKFVFAGLLMGTLPSGAAPLDWEEVKSLATGSATLRSAATNVEASEAAVKQSYGNFLPDLSLSARKSRNKTQVSILETESRTRNYSVAANWNLFSGFASVATTGRARAASREAKAQRDLTSAELRYQLRRSYFSVYVQQERIRLFEKVVKRQQQNEKLISLKYENGTEARWNVLKTRADRERAEFNLSAARAELEGARDQLARHLHIDRLPGQVVAAVSLVAPPPAGDEARALDHPELRASAFSLNRLGADQGLARAAFWPTLDLTYSRSREQNELGNRLRTDGNALALTAQWNIFNGLSDSFALQRANLVREAGELEREALTRRLLSDLRSARISFTNGLNRLPSAKLLREAADERVRTVSSQYRSGLKTYLDFEQAEAQLLEAEQQEVAALNTALLALADFERSGGITLEEP